MGNLDGGSPLGLVVAYDIGRPRRALEKLEPRRRGASRTTVIALWHWRWAVPECAVGLDDRPIPKVPLGHRPGDRGGLGTSTLRASWLAAAGQVMLAAR
ncbi:MAG: hypothetical protein ACRD0V_17685 [Acidimicrobiales bacterium]